MLQGVLKHKQTTTKTKQKCFCSVLRYRSLIIFPTLYVSKLTFDAETWILFSSNIVRKQCPLCQNISGLNTWKLMHNPCIFAVATSKKSGAVGGQVMWSSPVHVQIKNVVSINDPDINCLFRIKWRIRMYIWCLACETAPRIFFSL